MSEYPIKARFNNDSDIATKFATRQLESLSGTAEEKRPDKFSDENLETVGNAVLQRQKTNIVIEDKDEKELVLECLKNFRDGIAHPGRGGKWATTQKYNALNRAIEEIEEND